MRTTPVPFRLDQSPLGRPPSPGTHAHRKLCVATKAFMVTQVQRFFPAAFAVFPNRRSQPYGILSSWREPTTCFRSLSSRSSTVCSVCILPLIHSGRISAPWLPTTYARLPLRVSGTPAFPRQVAFRREDFTSRILSSNEPLCQFYVDSAVAV